MQNLIGKKFTVITFCEEDDPIRGIIKSIEQIDGSLFVFVDVTSRDYDSFVAVCVQD